MQTLTVCAQKYWDTLVPSAGSENQVRVRTASSCLPILFKRLWSVGNVAQSAVTAVQFEWDRHNISALVVMDLAEKELPQSITKSKEQPDML